MNRVFVHGIGAVSPAGWGVTALGDMVRKGEPLPITSLARPGWQKTLRVRPVPPPSPRPAYLGHPRLRRSSVIAQHTLGAAMEALGEDAVKFQKGEQRLGILICLMSGSVTYSRRFYEEVLDNPSLASPLLFPETVFNAPGSHLAAYLKSQGINYTLVGDDASFVQAMAIGAGWLLDNEVDGCLVLGAEETDWIVADAIRLFSRQAVQAGGAGAVYLRRESGSLGVELSAVTDACPFSSRESRFRAARTVRAQLPPETSHDLLCLGTQGLPAIDAAELEAWRDWKGHRITPKKLVGEAFTASAAWQCIAACQILARGDFHAANVSVVGANQQAIGARLVRSSVN